MGETRNVIYHGKYCLCYPGPIQHAFIKHVIVSMYLVERPMTTLIGILSNGYYCVGVIKRLKIQQKGKIS